MFVRKKVEEEYSSTKQNFEITLKSISKLVIFNLSESVILQKYVKNNALHSGSGYDIIHICIDR